MNAAIAWFARNSVAANLLMMGIIIAGLLTAPTLKQTVFPDFDIDLVSVTVVYPGASPEEIEKSITIRIEEEIADVEGIEEIRSSANEGATNLLIEIDSDADSGRVLDEIETRVLGIDTFPEEAERPIIQEIQFASQVLDIAIHGEVDEKTLKLVGQQLRDEIAALPKVSQVDLVGARPFEISIAVSEAALQRYGLRFDDVVMAVRRSSLDLPGGSVKTGGGEILLRTEGQAYWGRDFERIPLVTRGDGTRITIGDIAFVDDGFEESAKFARFDGSPSVFVQVHRVGSQQALELAAEVLAYLPGARARAPEGVNLTVWDNDSAYLGDRIDMMLVNARNGFFLVILLLAFFLKLRVAFWVAMGLPVAVAGGLALMSPLGLDINILTVFAFIMALGILVDDAIVTGENIYTHQQQDPSDPMGAAIRGTQEVATPVVFGVLTTIAAFAPFALIDGDAKFMATAVGGVMMASLVFSLVESKFVLPAHLAHGSGVGDEPTNWVSIRWARVQDHVAAGLRWFIDDVYAPAVKACIEWRYLTAAFSFSLFAVCVALVAGGHVKTSMMPKMEMDGVYAALTMPLGTPAAETADAVARLEAAALELQEELDAERLPDEPLNVKHMLTIVGSQRSFGPGGSSDAAGQSHLGEIMIELSPGELRSTSAPEIADRWRHIAGAIPGVEELVFVGAWTHFGDPLDIELRADDIDSLLVAAADLQEGLAEYPGVFDIRDSYREGKQELKLEILPSAEALGLTREDVARQVRQAFYGAEAQRIQRGRDEVKVMIRYPQSERRSLADVENMRVRLADGTAVPFLSVARADLGRGVASINRRDRYRTVRVTASVDESKANTREIATDLEANVIPLLLRNHPGVGWTFRGEQKESREALSSLRVAALVALLTIFTLIAIPLRSYGQAIVIMLAIPFGYVGAIIGHGLLNHQMSFLSMIGVMACAGVVVNDSLVLVSFLNRLRDEGVPLKLAAQQAGQRRFRAIMLTSLTTFAGLTPIMMDQSSQAQFVAPMAISLAFGVLVATAFTLLLIPASVLIAQDVKEFFAALGRVIADLLRTLIGQLGLAAPPSPPQGRDER